MIRREFLKGSFSVFGTALIGNNVFAEKLYMRSLFNTRESVRHNRTSLNILTDKAEIAANIASGFLSSYGFNNLTFSEVQYEGKLIGDVTCTLNGKLVNFIKGDGNLAKQLRTIRQKLNLPSQILNPIMITFTNEIDGSKPESVSIFSDNQVIEKFNLKNATGEMQIQGKKGELYIKAFNGSISAIRSSCTHQTCIKRGFISKSGESIVCIPNGIVVSIDGSRSDGIDSISF